MRIDVTLLGQFAVRVDGEPVPPHRWARRHSAALVKLLALTPSRGLHRERVLDTLWPDLPLADSAPRLHKAAHYARRALGSRDALVLGADSVRLCPADEVHVDALEFQRLAEVARAEGGVAAAKAALARYDGELLPMDVFEAWTQPARERLHRLHRELLRQAGDWHQLAAVDPTDEHAHLALVRRHAERGDWGAALRHLRRLESALRRELGLGPSATAAAVRAQVVAGADRGLARLQGALACVGLDGAGSPADQSCCV